MRSNGGMTASTLNVPWADMWNAIATQSCPLCSALVDRCIATSRAAAALTEVVEGWICPRADRVAIWVVVCNMQLMSSAQLFGECNYYWV